MEKNNFPRVLIVSAVPIGPASATGITLMNLFNGWPIDRIAQIYDDKFQPDASICKEYRSFSTNDMYFVRSAKKALSGFRGKSIKNIKDKGLNYVAPSGSISHTFFGACGDVVQFKIPAEIIEWIRNFQPDVIYSLLGSVRMMNITSKIRDAFGIPVVPHFMDDWPSTVYANSLPLLMHRLILNRKIKDILKHSPRRLTICEDMSFEYRKRYGGDFVDFMNCVDIKEANSSDGDNRNKSGVVFGYVGGLHLNRWRSLISVVEALQKKKNSGYNLSIEIFSPEKDIVMYGAIFSNYSVVSVIGTLNAEEVNKKINSLDVLVHVESFIEGDSLYTRLSVSTKIPQYMASGRPIVGYGPIKLSSIKYIEASKSGLIVGREGDMLGLERVCGELTESKKLRSELGRNGFLVANSRHNSRSERERFRALLCEAIDLS